MTHCISRLSWRGLAGISLIALSGAVGLSAPAQAQSLGPLVRVAAGDPFTGCSADKVENQEARFGSVLYPASAIEPWVAVDPTDPSRILLGHQQDRWSDGGARGLTGAVSNNGGATWSPTIPGGVTKCTDGVYMRASDPWVDFAQDGTAFYFSLPFDSANPKILQGSTRTAAVISRSTDHGATWAAPITLIDEVSRLIFNDKNSVTADPTRNGSVYAVWDRVVFMQPSSESDRLLALGDGVAMARERLNSKVGASSVCAPVDKPPCLRGAPLAAIQSVGPSYLSVSSNNGVSWGAPASIYDPGLNAQTINNLVQVLPSGEVLDFFTNIAASGQLSIGLIRSPNKAISWSAPTFPQDIQVVSVVSPDAGEPVRDASILFSVSVNRVNGAIYLAWQDDRFSSDTCTTLTGTIPVSRIAFSQSLDGGHTWSTPIRIERTPANANACREQAFIPAVAATGDGKSIVVTYYDFRNDANSPAGFEATDYFAEICDVRLDCSKRINWGDEQRLTNASFNILDAPVASGHFMGDYMGLAAGGPNKMHPVFGVAASKNRVVEFTREITVRP